VADIVLMVGLAGAGKTTYVNMNLALNHQVLCLDDIRLSLGDVFNWRTEPVVRAVTDIMGRAFLERGLPMVVDSTCCSVFVAAKWRKLADEYNYKVTGIHLDTPYEECAKRRIGINKVTEDVLLRQNQQLAELLSEKEKYFDTFTVIKESD
jgi:predicted kinase